MTGPVIPPDARLLARVRDAAGGVPDPELPVVTLAQLGMVHDVVVEDDRVVVELLPTFSGCPATEMMGRDVRTAVARDVPEVGDVGVRWLFTPVWSTDRITATGHEQLRSFGIAPPTGAGTVSTLERPAGARALPVAPAVPADMDAAPADTDAAHADTDAVPADPDAPPADPVRCPWCDATTVTEDSPFGPTPCRASWHCEACLQPFERFKPL